MELHARLRRSERTCVALALLLLEQRLGGVVDGATSSVHEVLGGLPARSVSWFSCGFQTGLLSV